MANIIGLIVAVIAGGVIVWSLIWCVGMGGLSVSEWAMAGNNPFPILGFLVLALLGGLALAGGDGD